MPSAVTLIRSSALSSAAEYAYAATAPADSRLIFLAGSCPLNDDGSTAGVGDYAAQAARCIETMTIALHAASAELTDVNAALFDAANQFAGCIPGIHEVLRRQGLLAGRWCLDAHEDLSPGQVEAIDRGLARYRHLSDDGFVRENLGRWMA